jgi:eukaryotic-like serine/threonine-protein kinase
VQNPVQSAPIVYGKYQLLARLARGGMGEVWKARSHGVEGFEKILVIKRILPALSENQSFVELFIEEAKTAVMLTHANIAQVFDLGLTDDTYFMAMEYVKGPDLGAVLVWCKERAQPIPPELAIYIVSELAKGLDYAHRRRNNELLSLGIVHRDVSPENVLLSLEGEVKLTDFGMARARASVRALSELPPVKYAYLAPEQVRDEDVDGRADVYALGVILYEALTGTRVIDREPARDTLERARRGDALDVSELAGPELDALRKLVERATAPRREARHANAGELYEELIELLYESGRRVSALELARWLEDVSASSGELQAELQEGSEGTLGPLSGLTEIFTEARERPSVPSLAPVPSDLDSSPEVVPLAPEPGSFEAAFAPRSEWRDVSVLLVSAEQPLELSGFAPRFGGQLLRLADGREQLLVFGLGEANGRDAHAAARCALRLVQAHARQGVRVVVHCGRLLLDGDGHAVHEGSQEALRSEAARWLKRAKKGELLASPTAASLLRERFELSAEHGSGARAIARERSPSEGVGKFIGRREELRLVGEVFALANQGELRVLGLQGEAGMGKSRLIIEIERRLRHAGHDVGMYVATCSPEGRAIPFFAVQELMRAVLGLEELEPPERVHEQIERLRQLGLSSEQRDAIARLVGLSTASTAPGGNTVKLEQALVRVAYKLAQDRLTVLVLDGAEFMDPASRELALRLISAPFSSRVIVVFAYRPLDGGPWTKLPNFDVVHLGPLADEEVARLVRHRLSATEVHGDLVREVLLKTGGNPLFVEELLVAMREHGTVVVESGLARLVVGSAQVELPRTLRGLVASRVGKLSGAHRLIMQLAVTFGPRFSPELLARAAELDEGTVQQALAQLAERDIVRVVGPSEHAFVHDLVREVLYGAIPLDERPALHAAVARAIETLLPAELEAAVERLAHHYREAGRWDAAVHYLSRAGERYEAEHALDAAIEAYTQVIELVSHAEAPDRARVLALHARIGELAFHTRGSELVADRMGGAIELAESWGSEEYLARFAMLRGRLLNKASRFREGRLWLERAQAMARRRGDRELERDVALAAAEAHARNGEYTAVVQYVGDALEVSRATGDVASEARALLLIAPAYAAVGEIERAREALAKLTALIGEQPPRLVAVELLRARALVHEAAGEIPAACEAARGALDLAKEYGLVHEVAVYAHHLGSLHLRVDEEKRAFAALRLSYDVSTEHGFARLQWRNVCLLGFLDALRFDSEQGYARMQQAVQYAQERGYVLDLIDEKYLLAMVEQKRDRNDRAAVLLREVIELADPHGHVRKCEDAEAALRALGDGVAIALPR